jgi:4-alpha-glucanotransferase
MLPLGPPAIAGCPYQSFSAMAGDPNLISPELLLQDGLLTADELNGLARLCAPDFAGAAPSLRSFCGTGVPPVIFKNQKHGREARATNKLPGSPRTVFPGEGKAVGSANHTRIEKRRERARRYSAGWINFAKASALKNAMLAKAWERYRAGQSPRLKAKFEAFQEAEKAWLADYALFMALKEAHLNRGWTSWPRELVFRKATAVKEACRELRESIVRHEFAQFLFFRQLHELRQRAASLGVKLIGDLPIFVSGESADVWSNPGLFRLDRDRRPKFVSGVPPDYFSMTGQRWGNPLYHWNAMKRDGFRWWIDRARMALRQADLVRIDHFRGFSACWTIPAGAPTAEHGRWVKSPGHELFSLIKKELGGLPFIAEDLGLISPDVEKLRDQFGLPGMRVLQFAFGGDSGNPFLPHNFARNCVAYTGTHDNDTTVGWYKSLDGKTRRHLRDYAPDAGKDPAGALIRLAWSSVADIAIAPLQDVLSLGSEARMNTPGTCEGNWRWRATEKMLSERNFQKLVEMTEVYGRSSE